MTVACLRAPQDPDFLKRTTPMRRMLLGYQPDMEMPGGGYSNAKHAFHGVSTAASKQRNPSLGCVLTCGWRGGVQVGALTEYLEPLPDVPGVLPKGRL